MNELTESLVSNFTPTMAIMIYKNERDKYYLESHVVDAAGRICEGKPLQQATISSMIASFYTEKINRNEIGGMMPENLLTYGQLQDNYKMVWYTPSGTRMLHFSEELKLRSGVAQVPAMVFVADRNQLDVYALATEKERPTEASLLYHAPFYNVNNGGGVCLGSATTKMDNNTFSGHMEYWEKLFWNSIFTHLSGGNPTKTNVTLLWMRLLEDLTLSWAQLDELLPHTGKQKTIKDLLK